MKKVFAKALHAKQLRRQVNAAKSAAEKFGTLDRLHDRSKQLKAAKLVRSGRR